MLLRALPILLACSLLIGCAGREAISAFQQPAQLPQRALLVQEGTQFSRQMTLGSVVGISEYSWFLPEPNRATFVPRFNAALSATGLQAPDRDLARYTVNFEFFESDGAMIGGHLDVELVGYVWVVDRVTDDVIFADDVHAYREVFWPGIFEHQWVTGTWSDVINILPFFSDSPWFTIGPVDWNGVPYDGGADWGPGTPMISRPTDGRLYYSENGRPYGSFWGPARAAQVNAAAIDALTAAFLKSFAEHFEIPVRRVLPCDGGPDLAALKLELLRSGQAYVSTPCPDVLQRPLF